MIDGLEQSINVKLTEMVIVLRFAQQQDFLALAVKLPMRGAWNECSGRSLRGTGAATAMTTG